MERAMEKEGEGGAGGGGENQPPLGRDTSEVPKPDTYNFLSSFPSHPSLPHLVT